MGSALKALSSCVGYSLQQPSAVSTDISPTFHLGEWRLGGITSKQVEFQPNLVDPEARKSSTFCPSDPGLRNQDAFALLSGLSGKSRDSLLGTVYSKYFPNLRITVPTSHKSPPFFCSFQASTPASGASRTQRLTPAPLQLPHFSRDHPA